ncbi:hypothetical protein DWY99_12895 [[Clostridium] leptum]|uniref:Uncharacterized protein n=1 Tax=[Clostridium] leptum TaxID=1535 RepID=A0A412AUJ7_9FIRM|nr:hypothetical protein DWY99_12895 [[Clostridium] leptum]
MKKSIFYSEKLLCPGFPEKLSEEYACALTGVCCTDQSFTLENGAAARPGNGLKRQTALKGQIYDPCCGSVSLTRADWAAGRPCF